MPKREAQPGDIIEIPLPNGRMAYARVFDDCGYAPYCVIAKERLPVQAIRSVAHLDPVTVFEYKVRPGEWPIVGQHPFALGEDPDPPPKRSPVEGRPGKFTIYHRGQIRPATAADMSIPLAPPRFTETTFIRFIMQAFSQEITPDMFPAEPRRPVYDPVEIATSVDKGDVADKVRIEFDECLEDGYTPQKAAEKTIERFQDELDDSDFVPDFWLALAAMMLDHNSLTPVVKKNALAEIDSGRALARIDNWIDYADDPAVRERRARIIASFRDKLLSFKK